MKKLYTLLFGLTTLLLASCKDEGTVEVTNNIQYVKLEYISFGDKVPVATSLLSGETAQVTVDHKMKDISFPIQAQLMFYMTAGEHRVLLYTKDTYTLDKDDHLQIVLTNDTKVVNPATNVSTGDNDDDNDDDVRTILNGLSIREFME
ncbi:MAG: hypothetical protein LUH15_18675 [Tannerellaceae bacterium]|nr:hypothetical protein [Tannerellaceae bacterium]